MPRVIVVTLAISPQNGGSVEIGIKAHGKKMPIRRNGFIGGQYLRRFLKILGQARAEIWKRATGEEKCHSQRLPMKIGEADSLPQLVGEFVEEERVFLMMWDVRVAKGCHRHKQPAQEQSTNWQTHSHRCQGLGINCTR